MSSRSLNKVLLIGNLTRDPELRYTPQGTPVCTFGLATNRSWQPTNGERQEETEFHRIVAWNKLAELCSELLFKGRKVFVEGRLQTRNWTDAQGQERTTVEIVIDNMIVLDSKRKDGAPAGEYEEAEPEFKEEAPAPQEEAGTKAAKPAKAPVKKVAAKKAAEPAPEQVNPDDIPF
jgi:single-strand DNA-binding protein